MIALAPRDLYVADAPQGDLEYETWITLSDAAQRTGLGVTTLRTQYYRGRLQAEMRGRDLWVQWGELQRYIRERKQRGRYRADVHAEDEP